MRPKETTVLNVRNLRIERCETVILNDVSWRVKRGEHWAILGPNGSGKTSLLNALTAYLSPTAGTIEVLGERYGESDWRELRKRIGLVSSSVRQMMADDEPALETVVSGKYAMIDYRGEPSTADRKHATQILKSIECSHIARRPWRVLSQGERQRVLIGRALMANPPLLILDEPCAGLDPVAREHFLQFLQKLARRKSGPTIILVTHHVEEIMPALSHVLLLKAGGVLAQGTKTEVLTSESLSRAFGSRAGLAHKNGRYTMSIATKPRGVM
ncbi:MAG TPA: ABC transporter ATP-binding protein [Verrucomicrobiae bacterium]|nr:ABC transporter ATP-binding protein [Verrucomicrobiae bacterium]